MPHHASFDIVKVTDLSVILIDLDQGRSITNDAHDVIKNLDILIQGGIGPRNVYYRDTTGRFDQLLVNNGNFTGFAPCSPDQQKSLANLIAGDSI